MGNNVTTDNVSVILIMRLKCAIYGKKKGGLATAVLYPGRNYEKITLFFFIG